MAINKGEILYQVLSSDGSRNPAEMYPLAKDVPSQLVYDRLLDALQ
jgi:hypothetical protein